MRCDADCATYCATDYRRTPKVSPLLLGNSIYNALHNVNIHISSAWLGFKVYIELKHVARQSLALGWDIPSVFWHNEARTGTISTRMSEKPCQSRHGGIKIAQRYRFNSVSGVATNTVSPDALALAFRLVALHQRTCI